MRVIERLKKEAMIACEWRGHKMKRYTNTISPRGEGKKPNRRAWSECKACGAYVHCETHPAPNGIDIGGDAVAINCKGE